MKHPLHKLTSIVAILFLFSLSAFADNDVTSTYLTNADFETSVTGDALDNTIYDVAGWTEYKTPQTISYYKLGSVLYGAATAGLGTVPANGSSVTTGNTALLGMKLHWYQNDSICVSQTATNLPAGTYKLTWDSYMAEVNAFVAANQSSRCGVQIDGTVFYTALPTAKTTWTNNSVTFTITSTKNVNVRMGYKKNANMGGNDSPILFIDNVKLIQITTPIFLH